MTIGQIPVSWVVAGVIGAGVVGAVGTLFDAYLWDALRYLREALWRDQW